MKRKSGITVFFLIALLLAGAMLFTGCAPDAAAPADPGVLVGLPALTIHWQEACPVLFITMWIASR